MALKIKALGASTLSNTGTTTLYTADATAGQTKAAIIGSIILCYTYGTALSVRLRVKSGGTTGQIYPTTSMSNGARISVIEKITLAPGESIEVNLSAAPYPGAFTWCISGFERDTGT